MRKQMVRAAGLGMAMGMMITALTPVTARAVTFSDTASHWASTTITSFADAGYVSGYTDGTFKPDGLITRAEFMVMVNGVLGVTVESTAVGEYADAQGGWYTPHIARALTAGYISGYNTTPKTMGPNDNITREQAFLIVSKVAKLTDASETKAAAFSDYDKTSSWAKEGVAKMINEGKVSGKSDSILDPAGFLTRAEAVTILNNNLDKIQEDQYVLMNIPYEAFFAAEIENEVAVTDVDVTSTATVNTSKKTMRGWTPAHEINEGTEEAPVYGYGMVSGSYRTEANVAKKINGITYPVLVDKNVDLSKYTEVKATDSVQVTTTKGRSDAIDPIEFKGADALFVADDYAYFTLTEKPAFYKEVKLDAATGKLVFGKAEGTVTKDADATAVIEADHLNDAESGEYFGDFKITVTDMDAANWNKNAIYGVVVEAKTADGKTESYGMLPLKNYWRNATTIMLSPVTKQSNHHGDFVTLNTDHFANVQGGTVTKITWYTSEGIFYMDTDLKVGYASDAFFSLKDADVTATETGISWTGELPSDYQAEYTADGVKDFEVSGDKATFTVPADAVPGTTVTVTAKDKGGKYNDKTTTFMLTTTEMPAEYKEGSLVAKEDATPAALEAYLAKVTTITLKEEKAEAENPKTFTAAVSGRTPIEGLLTDGKIDFTKVPDLVSGTYTVTVQATGYEDLKTEHVAITIPEKTE